MIQQLAEKMICFGLLKNAQMQGSQNPEAQELANDAYLK